jgi:Tol biopolymer transport system component
MISSLVVKAYRATQTTHAHYPFKRISDMTTQTVNRGQSGRWLLNMSGLPKTISVLLALGWLTACAGVQDTSPPTTIIERATATKKNEVTQVEGTPTEITVPTTTPIEIPFLSGGGRIAFASERDGTLDIYVMDVDTGNMTRLTHTPAHDSGPAWSPDGTKIAFMSEQDGNHDIYVMDSDGSNVTRLTNDPASEHGAAWSPNGEGITFVSDREGNYDIYIMDSDGSNVTRLTDNPASDANAAWSPDGTQIVFASDRGGNLDIYVMNSDGSNVTRLTDSPAQDVDPAWSPDGKQIVFVSNRDDPNPAILSSGTNREIYLMKVDGSSPIRLTDNPAYDIAASWSPDGNQIIFVSTRDGDFRIYVMNADGSNQTRLTNDSVLEETPAWLP